MLSLSLCTLFWDISCFPILPSNPCFLRQNPWFLRRSTVLPGILRALRRVVHGRGPCVARRRLQPRKGCYPGVQFNLLARSPIPGPRPASVLAGDWGADLRGSSVSRTLQRRFLCIRLSTPILAKGVLPFSMP